MSFVPQPTEVLLQNVRVSYCHLLEPWANSTQPGAKPRYSATILLPKSDVAQHQALMNAIEAAIQSARTKFGARVPAQPKVPIMTVMAIHNLVRSLVLNVKVIGYLQQHKMLAIKLK